MTVLSKLKIYTENLAHILRFRLEHTLYILTPPPPFLTDLILKTISYNNIYIYIYIL